MSRRQGRFHHGGSDSDDGGSGPSSSSAAVVDHAECTARSCRSCVADCIALGCCPCAVVSLLGLALVKAPLAVGRRCVRRLRQKKRVRDDMVDLALAAGHAAPGAEEDASKGEDDVAAAAASEAERVWLEMYQVGQWGFGRLSFSVNPPATATATPAKATCDDELAKPPGSCPSRLVCTVCRGHGSTDGGDNSEFSRTGRQSFVLYYFSPQKLGA